MSEHLNQDLSDASTHAFFAERAPELAKAISGMESCEPWTHDRVESVNAALQRFADRVEDYDFDNIPVEQRSRLIVLLGYISSGRAIKLLMWVDQNSPNFVARTLAEAQMLAVVDKVNEEAARLFIERFEILERLHLLSRVFCEERFPIVMRTLNILAGREDLSGDDDDLDDDLDLLEGDGNYENA